MASYELQKSLQVARSGWASISSRLKNVPKKTLEKVLKKSLKFGANRIKTRAKAACPRDSGKLQRSINVRAVTENSDLVGYDIGAGDRNKNGAWYAHLIEFGYMMRARGKAARVGNFRLRARLKGKTSKIRHVPGKFFMTKSIEAESEPILNEVMDDLIEVFSE